MRIILWEAATGQQRHVLKGRFANIWNAAFSHSGTRLACASGDKTVRLWDVPSPGK